MDGQQSGVLQTRKSPLWQKLVLAVALTVIAYYLGQSIATQWQSVRSQPWNPHFGWLLLSAFVLWIGVVWLVQLWRMLVVSLSSSDLSLISAYRMTALANLGKYLPGKIWSVMGLIYLATREGHSGAATVAATAMHQAYTILSGILFVSLVLGTELFDQMPIVLIVLVVASGLVVIFPPVFGRLLNSALRAFKREPVELRITTTRALLLFVAYICAWVVYGTGFWLMSLGLGIPPGPFWPVVASYGAAYLAGFLVLFAPGGLGVREGTLALLLAPHLPPGLPAFVAVVSRLWMTLIELLGLLPVLRWTKPKSS